MMNKIRNKKCKHVFLTREPIYVPLVGYQARSVFGAVPTFISLESLCSLRVYKKKNITLNFLFLNLGECILNEYLLAK